DETALLRFLGGEGIATEDHGRRPLLSHPLAHPPEVTTAGMDAHVEKERIECGAAACHHDVASEDEVHPGADHGSVYRCDHGDGERLQRLETAIDPPDVAVAERVQVAARGEDRSLSAQNHHPSVGIP